ncbi:MAG: ABC transporter substrate-binding protein [Nocardioidaceae bacterium]
MTVLGAALVTPLSGPLGGFGRDGAEALSLWADEAAQLPAPYTRVELTVYDAEPDPAGAMRTAAARAPLLVFGPYGSGPAQVAIGATDRLVWNHGGAASTLCWPRYANAINVLSPASSYLVGPLELVRAVDPRARTAVLAHSSTGFAKDVAAGAKSAATRLGFSAQVTSFASGRAESSARDLPDGDVLLVVGRFADEIAVGRTLLCRPWRAATFVGAGEEDVLAALGEAREGLLGPAQWMPQTAPEPDEGPDAGWFVSRFEHGAGRPPSYPAAQAFAAGVLAARALREAGAADDAALLAVAKTLSCTTLYGAFRLDPHTGLQVGHQVVTVQWQHGRRRVVWPESQAQVIYPRASQGR